MARSTLIGLLRQNAGTINIGAVDWMIGFMGVSVLVMNLSFLGFVLVYIILSVRLTYL